MLTITNEKIDGSIYVKLLEFLLSKCDKVSFAIPNYKTVFKFGEWESIFAEYNKIRSQINRNNSEFADYISNIEFLLEKINIQLINVDIGIQYFDQLYGYEIETHIYNYNNDVFEILKEVEGLYKWRAPNFPEDLYFFSNGKCYLSSISHEKECWIYDNSEETISFIESLGLDYYICEDNNPPKLDDLLDIDVWTNQKQSGVG